MAIVGLPEWCLSTTTNAFRGTRHDACGIWNQGYYVQQRTGGTGPWVVTGTGYFTMVNYVYALPDTTTWANQLQIAGGAATGTAVGARVSAVASCTGDCAKNSSSFSGGELTQGVWRNGESYYDWNGVRGQVGAGQSKWVITLTPAAGTGGSLSHEAPFVRCDHKMPGNQPAGCVIRDVTPRLAYDRVTFPEFTTHITMAQSSGLPGGFNGAPLHRTSAAQADANRYKACEQPGYARPANLSCDEYPFASSIEGAASGGGTARTFDWCEIVLSAPPSTGATGFSVCMINLKENVDAGRALNTALYMPRRILEGDAYRVGVS